jgi:hypothetical protein
MEVVIVVVRECDPPRRRAGNARDHLVALMQTLACSGAEHAEVHIRETVTELSS